MAATTYTVERSTHVAAPPARVYAEVADFRRWPAWSPWEGLDPELRRDYSGAERGDGAVYTWTGNRKAGEGRMEITHADEPSRVVVDLQFVKPWRSSSVTTFTFAPSGEGTLVTWTMAGPLTPALRAMRLVGGMDRLVGRDFDKGLAQLAAVVEAQPG